MHDQCSARATERAASATEESFHDREFSVVTSFQVFLLRQRNPCCDKLVQALCHDRDFPVATKPV